MQWEGLKQGNERHVKKRRSWEHETALFQRKH